MKEVRGKKGRIAYRSILAAVLAFVFVCSLPEMLAAEGDGLWYTNSILAFLLWLLIAGLINHIFQYKLTEKKRDWLIPGLFGLFFSICMVFGTHLEINGSVAYTDVGMWLCILTLSICFSLFVRYAWDRLKEALSQKWEEQKDRNKKELTADGQAANAPTVRSFLIRMGIILLCYFPVLLAVYPGFFVYDAQDEILQVITRNFTTHHPLSHVLFMGGVVQLVYKLSGSYNLGIACYTFIQMTILAGIFSFVIGLLQKEGMRKKERAVLTLYFGLWPVIVMFALCSAKDGLFMGMVLMQVMMIREFVKAAELFFQKKGHVALLIFSSLGMMLLRHNGFYAFAVFAVLFFLLVKKIGFGRQWKKTLLLFVGILLGYLLINQGLARLVHARESGSQELLTVPIQQMTRVHQMYGDSLTEEDKNTLYEILPEEALERYKPKLSDSVKYFFHNGNYQADPSRYVRLWWKLGCEYPLAYLDAWFMTSYGFWYPDTVIDVYRGNSTFTFTYEDSSYFGYEVEQPGVRESRLPMIDELYRRLSLEITQQKIPVVSMLFSPGFVFWVMAFFLCYFLYVGEIKKVIPYLVACLIWLTFLLGPTYLVRYVVYLWCLLPVLLYDVAAHNTAHNIRFDNWK